MKKILLVALLLSGFTFAKAQDQSNKDTSKRTNPSTTFVPREIVKEKNPIAYLPTREADIAWSKIVWRIIDCREKMNFPLYFPTQELKSRRSLAQALYDGIKSGDIRAYDDEEFSMRLSIAEIEKRMGAGETTRKERDINDESKEVTITSKNSAKWGEVREFLVKEEWYFDRKYSELFVRIIAICPTRIYKPESNTTDEEAQSLMSQAEDRKTQICWVPFADARHKLANTICFVGNNDLAQISFDDLLHKRRFQSYIVAESNPLNNRMITDYAGDDGTKAMMESERIKRAISNWEGNLWEY